MRRESPTVSSSLISFSSMVAAITCDLIEQLEAGKSDALTAFLDAMVHFHNYSFGNVLLIARQKSDATHVAGMYAWNQLSRRVKRGEKGIAILAPMIAAKRRNDAPTEGEEGKQTSLLGFRRVYVWDITQTEGAPLPEPEKVTGDVGAYLEHHPTYSSQSQSGPAVASMLSGRQVSVLVPAQVRTMLCPLRAILPPAPITASG